MAMSSEDHKAHNYYESLMQTKLISSYQVVTVNCCTRNSVSLDKLSIDMSIAYMSSRFSIALACELGYVAAS